MIIKAFDRYGIDMYEEEATRVFVDNLPILPSNDSTIEIDFTNCIIDYPGTSVIIDSLVDKLMSAPSPRVLTVLFNVKFPERLLLKACFFGSKICGLNYGTFSDEKLKEKIQLAVRSRDICFSIRIVGGGNEVIYEVK